MKIDCLVCHECGDSHKTACILFDYNNNPGLICNLVGHCPLDTNKVNWERAKVTLDENGKPVNIEYLIED
jgi:hypothetical protein